MAIKFEDIQLLITFVSMIAYVWLLVEFKGMKEAIKDKTGVNEELPKLQLQAYERIAMYAERNGLKNLVNRLQAGGESAAQLHSAFIDSLKSEYDYNVSQQIYIQPEVWNAVTKLKDQNIYIINQIAAALPQGATGIELARRLLEYSLQPNAELNGVVLDAIQFEAKKILKKN